MLIPSYFPCLAVETDLIQHAEAFAEVLGNWFAARQILYPAYAAIDGTSV